MASQSLSAAPSSRLLGLDLLRLAAIVMVLGRHMEPAPSDVAQPLKALLDVWHEYGGFGVDLFFVLSGFLVSGLLFSEYRKHGNLSLSRFYVRRTLKIYPGFYFLIGITYFYSLFVIGYRLHDRPVYSELLFIQCYQQGHWNHTWTLAVEEHFYLALPIVLLLIARRNRGTADPFRPVLYLVATASVACLAARIINYNLRAQVSYLTHAFPTHLRIDSLLFGVAIAYAFHFHADWFRETFARWRYGLIGVGSLLIGLVALLLTPSGAYYYTFGFTQLYLGSAAVLVGTLMCQVPNNRVTTALATLGAYSYSIYLWHMATMYYVIPGLRDAGVSWSLRMAIYFVSAFVVGILMAKLLEFPTLRLRDRFFPSRSTDGPRATSNETSAQGSARRAA